MTIADLVEQVRREKVQSDEYLQELIAQRIAFGDSGRVLLESKEQIKKLTE